MRWLFAQTFNFKLIYDSFVWFFDFARVPIILICFYKYLQTIIHYLSVFSWYLLIFINLPFHVLYIKIKNCLCKILSQSPKLFRFDFIEFRMYERFLNAQVSILLAIDIINQYSNVNYIPYNNSINTFVLFVIIFNPFIFKLRFVDSAYLTNLSVFTLIQDVSIVYFYTLFEHNANWSVLQRCNLVKGDDVAWAIFNNVELQMYLLLLLFLNCCYCISINSQILNYIIIFLSYIYTFYLYLVSFHLSFLLVNYFIQLVDMLFNYIMTWLLYFLQFVIPLV